MTLTRSVSEGRSTLPRSRFGLVLHVTRQKKKPPPVPVETAILNPEVQGEAANPGHVIWETPKRHHGQTLGRIELTSLNMFVGLTH